MPTVTSGRRGPLRQRTAHVAAPALALALALGTGAACSSGSPGSDTAVEHPTVSSGAAVDAPSGAPAEVATEVRLGKVYGRLPRKQRAALKEEVGTLVDDWWEAAFLGGSYPRAGFSDAFPGFTRCAESRARRDKMLTTNRDIGETTTAVTALRRAVTLDVLATQGRPRAVTARFRLRFEAAGDKDRRVGVSGRLFLNRRTGKWRVFGYEIAKWSKA